MTATMNDKLGSIIPEQKITDFSSRNEIQKVIYSYQQFLQSLIFYATEYLCVEQLFFDLDIVVVLVAFVVVAGMPLVLRYLEIKIIQVIQEEMANILNGQFT